MRLARYQHAYEITTWILFLFASFLSFHFILSAQIAGLCTAISSASLWLTVNNLLQRQRGHFMVISMILAGFTWCALLAWVAIFFYGVVFQVPATASGKAGQLSLLSNLLIISVLWITNTVVLLRGMSVFFRKQGGQGEAKLGTNSRPLVDQLHNYKRTFRAVAWTLLVPFVFLFLVAFNLHEYRNAILLAAYAASWVRANYLLRADRKHAFVFSMVVANLTWWPTLWLNLPWIRYVLVNGSMEGPNGEGSPLAFLLLVVEVNLFFIPSTLVMVRGCLVLAERFRNRKHPSGPS